jgi:hypothetical protein
MNYLIRPHLSLSLPARPLRRAMVLMMAALVLSQCRPATLLWVKPEGPAEYQLGWQDGCDTGMSAYSSIFYKMMYGYKKRPELGANDLYKQGWNEGFTYCRFSIDVDRDDEQNGFWGVFKGGGMSGAME